MRKVDPRGRPALMYGRVTHMVLVMSIGGSVLWILCVNVLYVYNIYEDICWFR